MFQLVGILTVSTPSMFPDLPTVQQTVRRPGNKASYFKCHGKTLTFCSCLSPSCSLGGPSFSFSVWFVELRGVVEEGRVEVVRWYEEVGHRVGICACCLLAYSPSSPCSTESMRQCDSV